MKYSQEQLKKIHVKQLGEYACGLACISAISKYYGGNISQEKLREISGTTLNGTTLLGLYQAAKKIGFEARGFEADIENLKKLDHPVILHVVMDQKREHFVVCYGYENDMFVIGDPGWGVVSFSTDELEAIWRSKALLQLTPVTNQFPFTGKDRKSQFDWFKSLIKDDIPILVVSAVIGLVMAVLGLSMAIFLQKLIDDFLPNNDGEKILIGFVALLILLIARAVLELIRGIFMARQGKDLNIRIIRSFLKKLFRLPMIYFKGYSTGDLIARMNDSMRIRNTVALITGNVLISCLVVIISSIYLIIISVPVGLISVSSIAAFLFIAWRYHSHILSKQKEVMAAHSANESQYIDTLTGIGTIKSFSKENTYYDRINAVYDHYQTKGFELSLLGNRFGFVTQLVVSVYVILIFAVGVWYVLQGQILLGELMALVTVAGSMIPSLAGLMIANIHIQEAKVAFNRMYELTEMEPEPETNKKVIPISTNHGDNNLSVQNLTFRFPGRKLLLSGINLEIRTGEMITLFGQVGGGKSTLVDLIQWHYTPEQGHISISGKDRKQWPISQWRSQIAVVAQKEKIFNSTVIDNICMSNDPNELEKCINFFKGSIIGTFIETWPQDYLTLCGEEGANLSGGQNQLVSIARALYKRPRFLIMDESTSSMDYDTEYKTIKYLREVIRQQHIGILLVTHRLGLARQTDKIYILSQGKIACSGTHEQLTKTDNDYSKGYSLLIDQNQN